MSPVDPSRLKLAVLAVAGLFIASACLSDPAAPTEEPTAPTATEVAEAIEGETPEPTATPEATPEPTIRPTDDDTLVVIAPDHPTRLLPGDNLNASEKLLVDVLYDPLYRLDKDMRPVPELAKSLPKIKKTKNGNYEWSIPIKADARFHSGEKLKASDVNFSLRMAASHSCPLGRTLCETVNTYLVDEPERDANVVTFTLSEPYAPFLTEVLAQLPILSQEDVKEATAEMVKAADRLNENRPDKLITRIRESILRDVCFDAEPPDGCRLSDFRSQLESVFRKAEIDPPSKAPYTDGSFLDENAYLGELLDRLAALAQVFDSGTQDRNSAALGLLDATVTPFGSGPYKLRNIRRDGTYVLVSNPNHTRSEAKIGRMEIRVERDPELATTQLLNGAADWVLEVRADQARIIDGVDGYSAAARATDIQYGVLFNVRPDKVYFDQGARRAFVQCIDHVGLATALDEGRPLAYAPYTVTSWATPEGQELRERDVAAANALLETAGWQMAADGVRVREDGTRLSTTIAVRPTNVDLFAFANAATEQLEECGIELIVDQLDLTGGDTLNQLRYPNDFDTLMWTRWLGADPDTAVRAFESSRVTTQANVADENASGFHSELVDFHVAAARESMDFEERAESYAQVDAEIETLTPYWPLWYESATSAISARLQDREGIVDPAESRYDWDISAWSFRVPDASEEGS